MLPFLKAVRRGEKAPGSVEDIVLAIQQGDFALREQFIMEYKPFILKCAAKYTVSFQPSDSSDEYSIALIAFNEAINSFRLVKGMSFLGFSELVIRNRLTDNARKSRHQRNVIPFASLAHEEGDEPESFDVPYEDPSFGSVETRDEIKCFTLELKKYGIVLSDLVRLSPKHRDTRRRLAALAEAIYESPELLSKLKRTREIPIRELMELVAVYRGTVEQNRKYIIALVLILDSSLDTLKGYIQNSKGGELHAN